MSVMSVAAPGCIRQVQRLYCCRYEPAMRSTDITVQAALEAAGLQVHTCNTFLLREPETVRINMKGKWNGHFGTLMPFVR